MVLRQTERCAGEEHAERWAGAATIAPGIRVPAAIGDYLILRAIRDSGGAAIAVSDDQIRDGMALAAGREGMFVSPESGAAVAATAELRASGFLPADALTVVFSTGSGLMHADLVGGASPTIDPHAPDLLTEIEAAIGKVG